MRLYGPLKQAVPAPFQGRRNRLLPVWSKVPQQLSLDIDAAGLFGSLRILGQGKGSTPFLYWAVMPSVLMPEMSKLRLKEPYRRSRRTKFLFVFAFLVVLRADDQRSRRC